MNPKERIQAVLDGKWPDRVPVSFWHHFPPHQITGQAAVDAHVKFLEAYDLDFCKVMNDHPFPRGRLEVLSTAKDLRRIHPIPEDAEGFAPQLEVLRKLRERVGPDIFLCTTMFNAWTTMRNLTAPPKKHHGPPTLGETNEKDATLSRLLKEDRSAFQAALNVIGQSLGAFGKACLDAGADGIFLSVRDDWVDTPVNGPDVYDAMVRDVDLQILREVDTGSFNMLHVCGVPKNLMRFAAYPVQVLNWADRAAGPSLAYARDRVKTTLAGGVDNLTTLPDGSPEDCMEEVRDALRQAKGRPIIITPGCTYDPEKVPEANLHAVVRAAHEYQHSE